MKKFIVIGNPIKHSLSPLVHNYWFEQNMIEATYEKVLVEEKGLEDVIQNIRQEKIVGANVTVPFKQKIIPLLDELSEVALKTSSVNTVYKKNNKIIGDNTDVFGFQNSLAELVPNKIIQSVLLIGAGGVSPSIVQALKNVSTNKVIIANRTKEKFEVLKNKFGPLVQQILWDDLRHKKFDVDLVVNSTSLGLEKKEDLNFNFSSVNKSTVFYDVIYNPVQTSFLKQAEAQGHQVINGLKMFLYQALKAFQIWNKISPTIDKQLLQLMKKNLND
ncbi:MAG: shikimate dehydrogenase [alpha proteobacterium QL1]|nr:MAG: shikimate dehydrogenase [alpha proteobacterium QL1]